MSKFFAVAVLLAFIVCFALVANSQPQRLDDDSIIQKIIREYEAKIKGPSIIYPEETARVIDPNNFHLHI